MNSETEICKQKTISLAEQYALTIEEAAVYFRIGENKLRTLISNNPRAQYILRVGNRALIKRKMFEDYLDQTTDICVKNAINCNELIRF